MKFIILVIITISSSWAKTYSVSGEDCTPTDIRDHHPQLKEHFSKPQDQGPIGWCFGFTAADLLSVETGIPVSPVHVTTIFNKKIADSPLWKYGYEIGNLFTDMKFESVYEFGFVKSTLLATMASKAVCLDKDLPFHTDQGEKIHSLIKAIETIKKDYKNKIITEANACELIDLELSARLFELNHDKNKILTSILKDNLNFALEDIIRKKCGNRMLPIEKKTVRNLFKPGGQLKNQKAPSTHKARVNSYLKKVNDVLNEGKPLGISYDVKHVTDMSGMHVSTVTARRWNNGKCEYKIRNAWGESCIGYKDEISCESTEGSFWVTDETFFKMATTLTFIDG